MNNNLNNMFIFKLYIYLNVNIFFLIILINLFKFFSLFV